MMRRAAKKVTPRVVLIVLLMFWCVALVLVVTEVTEDGDDDRPPVHPARAELGDWEMREAREASEDSGARIRSARVGTA